MEQDVTHQLQLKAPKGKRIVGVDVIVRVADDN
jgi:hypothetical protein